MKTKLHIGCGRNILEGYINVDTAALAGVDVVHDLNVIPWPFADNQFDEIIMIDVLEHLQSVLKTMEEIHRITKKGARVVIRVPYYNSWDASYDPTHVHVFNENTFDFFDSRTEVGTTRGYYSKANFKIYCVGYLIYPTGKSLLLCERTIDPKRLKLPACYDKQIIRSNILKNVWTHAAHKLGNMIRTLHIELVRT